MFVISEIMDNFALANGSSETRCGQRGEKEIRCKSVTIPVAVSPIPASESKAVALFATG